MILRIGQLQRRLTDAVRRTLASEGFDLSEGQLALLSALDCGETYPAAVARRLDLSRQAIYRVTKEMEKAGFLTLQDDGDRGNQKIIVMTARGEALAMAAREALSQAEAELGRIIDIESLKRLLMQLDREETV
ncbi:MAG: MarR family transcriptional regulator [Alphaproteobacteria bacterium]|jgi:DNA-binding MarR family transcriptional regulator|nr:MarR family transcriptional regulator [Alphaproteobacteria bacterium]